MKMSNGESRITSVESSAVATCYAAASAAAADDDGYDENEDDGGYEGDDDDDRSLYLSKCIKVFEINNEANVIAFRAFF